MDVTLTDPGDSPSNKTKEQLNNAACIIIQRLSERFYNTVVTDKNVCSSGGTPSPSTTTWRDTLIKLKAV